MGSGSLDSFTLSITKNEPEALSDSALYKK